MLPSMTSSDLANSPVSVNTLKVTTIPRFKRNLLRAVTLMMAAPGAAAKFSSRKPCAMVGSRCSSNMAAVVSPSTRLSTAATGTVDAVGVAAGAAAAAAAAKAAAAKRSINGACDNALLKHLCTESGFVY